MPTRYSRVLPRWFPIVIVCSACLLGVGCRLPERLCSPERYEHGVVFALPGIEGPGFWIRDIALGLDEGGVAEAIEVYDWTNDLPGGFIINLADLNRNRRRARQLAQRIIEYQNHYPGRPVHLVGHSGGAGVAVLTLEALPPGREIESAILLAPALSPACDLTVALRRARCGIYNLYSSRDVSLLRVGTSLLGPIDRKFGVAAGAVGFRMPDGLPEADRVLYAERLRQVPWNPGMKALGADGSHLGWASRKFAREYLAPIIRNSDAACPPTESCPTSSPSGTPGT